MPKIYQNIKQIYSKWSINHTTFPVYLNVFLNLLFLKTRLLYNHSPFSQLRIFSKNNSPSIPSKNQEVHQNRLLPIF